MCRAVSRACIRKGIVEGCQIFECSRNHNEGLKYLVTYKDEPLFSFSPPTKEGGAGRWRYRGHRSPAPALSDVVPEATIKAVEELAISVTNEEIRRYNVEMEKRGMRNRAVPLSN